MLDAVTLFLEFLEREVHLLAREGIDVEAGIRFIEDREAWFEAQPEFDPDRLVATVRKVAP